MTIEDISNLGQAVAAVATVLSLVFVGFQVRQHTRATRAASHNSVSNALNEINRLFAENADLSEIWIRGLDNRGALSAVEQWRFDSLLRAYMHVCETMFVQAQLGTGDASVHLAEENGIRTVMASSGPRDWWRQNPFGFGSAFRAYVERVAPMGDSVADPEAILPTAAR